MDNIKGKKQKLLGLLVCVILIMGMLPQGFVAASSCEDCGNGWFDFSICDYDECINLGDCYFVDGRFYNECYDVPASGTEDYCYYEAQIGSGCSHGEYDCDWDSECSGSLYCKGPTWGDLDGCCNYNEEWDSDYNQCYDCIDGPTGRIRCNGDLIEKEYEKYEYGQCITEWIEYENCNYEDRYDSWGDYYCSGDEVEQKRRFYDYTCSSGMCVLGSSSDDYRTVESCYDECDNGECIENSDPYCGDGTCNNGEDSWSCSDDCGEPCAADQCTSDYWQECYDHGDLCCSGDDVFGQYYCEPDNEWAPCSIEWGYNLCEKQGDHYCTNEGNVLKWRKCDNGCSDGKCIKETISCEDECSSEGYFCDGNRLYGCEIAGECYEKTLLDYCRSPEICEQGKSSCQKEEASAEIQIEDAVSGVNVYKQPGDFVVVKIDNDEDGYIELEYDSSTFELEEGPCNGEFYIDSDKECRFFISDNAEGEYRFSIKEGSSAEVKVIDDPSVLLITNKQRLQERFNSEVDSLMEQAYSTASEEKGIIYDLGLYINKHPFSDLSDYDEGLLEPKDDGVNDYVLAVSGFVKERCNGCKNTIIVGDDYVVPHYRRDIDWENWYLVGSSYEEKNIYTDLPYIQTTKKQFNKLESIMYRYEYGEKYEGKDITFIVPRTMADGMEEEIENLKSILTREFSPNYKPEEGFIGDNVVCNDPGFLSDFNGKTLVVIGNEENNPAFKCFPFLSATEDDDAAFIEVNPWDGMNYAIVVNTNDANVLKAFNEIIDKNYYLNLKSEGAYFFHVGTRVAGYIALGFGVTLILAGSGGSAAPAVFITLSQVTEVVADGSDVVDTCKVNFDGYGWCGGTMALTVIPFLPSRPFKGILKNADSSLKQFIDSSFDFLRKNFDDNAIKQVIKTESDKAYFALGKFRFLDSSKNAIDDIPFEDVRRIHFLKRVGESENAFAIRKDFDIVFDPHMGKLAGSTNGKTIKINEHIESLGKSIDEVVPHEYAHAKIFEDLGDRWPAKLVDSKTVKNARLATYGFEEFLANDIAKKTIPDFSVSKISLLEDFASARYILNGMDYDEIASYLAFAKKHDSSKYHTMVQYLASQNPKAEQIIDLADTFSKYSNKINEKTMTEIAEKTSILMGGL
ncbi:hypothetical protein GF336_05195 [Candidatus Woesearchaeota archaeon]|nr:hypothetical protein [Candidatus Woesearchaeota archaeon]